MTDKWIYLSLLIMYQRRSRCTFKHRAVVVDSCMEVTCFTNVLLRANFETNKINAVVCAARHAAKYLVGTFKTFTTMSYSISYLDD